MLKDATSSEGGQVTWEPECGSPIFTALRILMSNSRTTKSLESGGSLVVPPRFFDKHKYVLAFPVKWGTSGNYSHSERIELIVHAERGLH